LFEDNNDIKLGYLNMRAFCESDHAEYLNNDKNLLNLDFLVLSETWLDSETSNQQVITKIDNWSVGTKRKNIFENLSETSPTTTTKRAKYVKTKVPEDQDESTYKKIDLDKLNPEEWLDDLIINEYCLLLSKAFGNNVFILSTFFLESLGYE
jgi:Ulp1 family protease